MKAFLLPPQLSPHRPRTIHTWTSWPSCASHCLIATKQLHDSVLDNWSDFQAWACGLFALWYHLERIHNAPERQGSEPLLPEASVAPLAVTHGCVQHAVSLSDPSERLPLQWKPFANRTEWASWKASLPVFARMFLFWSLWTPGHHEGRPCTWAEALLLYLALDGSSSHSLGPVSFPQAVFLFRTLSYKLLARCGISLSKDTNHKSRWHEDLPGDVVVSFATPLLSVPCDFIDVLVQLQQPYVADGATAAYVHVPYFDLIPGTDSRLHLSSDLFLFLRTRFSSKASALPWWSYKTHIKCALSHLIHSNPVDVQPGAGLMQFAVDVLLDTSVPCIIQALGANYMSTIAGLIRRWRTGLASTQPCNFGNHVVLPSWGSDDWVCKGCSRPANFTRDPTWATKPCPSPFDSSTLDFSSANRILDMLILIERRLRFHNFPFALSSLGLPNSEEIFCHLQEQFPTLDKVSFASLVSMEPSSAKLHVKLKECKLRWKAIYDAWSNAGHLLLPSSILCTDGFCLLCHVRPKSFQSFIRRPCHCVLGVDGNSFRHRLSKLHSCILDFFLHGGASMLITPSSNLLLLECFWFCSCLSQGFFASRGLGGLVQCTGLSSAGVPPAASALTRVCFLYLTRGVFPLGLLLPLSKDSYSTLPVGLYRELWLYVHLYGVQHRTV